MKPQLKLLVATLSTVVFAGMSGLAMASGAVQNLSGTISVQKPDGTIRVLAKNSEVTKGDTIETQKDSYAQVKFSDGATMTMKPGTRVKIDSYAFNQAEPMKDNSTLNLLPCESVAGHMPFPNTGPITARQLRR